MDAVREKRPEKAPEAARGRPREFDRDEVLRRAMELFWERGYEATSISDLVERLEIGRQSLYLAFGGKRQLFEEALARYAEREVGPLIELLEAPGSPLGNVRRLLSHWQKRASGSDFRGCLAGRTAAELGGRDPELVATLDAALRRLEDACTDALRRARDAGELPPDKNPRSLARMITTTAQGVALWSPVRRSPAWVRDIVGSLRRMLEA